MKNKKQEQIEVKKRHGEEMRKAARRRRGEEPNLERDAPIKSKKEKFLIVCEGKNTEPSYFEKFKLSTADIVAIGDGCNTISLVQRAYVCSQKDEYDQIWCVFDKDDFPIGNFNSAIELAHSYNFKVAYSNQAFEYWLILHFENHQGGGMHRNDYCKKLNQ